MTAKNQISEFLKPENFWDIFGINSQEDFLEKLLQEGNFIKMYLIKFKMIIKQLKDYYFIVTIIIQ